MSNDGEKKIEVELRRNAAANKRHNYELRAQTDTMSYSGTNYGPQVGPQFPRNKGPKLLVGVHDKRTQETGLVNAGGGQRGPPRAGVRAGGAPRTGGR